MARVDEIAVVLVAHGDYGRQMVEAAEAIVGPLDIGVVTVCNESKAGEVRRSITARVEGLDRGGGVLVLTDLCGSTPANVCQAVVARRRDCEVVTGVNLPMLIKLSTCDRTAGAANVAQELLGTSRRSITVGGPGEREGGACGD